VTARPEPDAEWSAGRLWLVLALCFGVGTCLRLYRLGHKTFWFDETWTAAHVTGHALADAERDLPAGAVRRASELAQYGRTDRPPSLARTMGLIAQTDANHVPLFYALEEGWSRALGDSPAVLRGLPAVFGIAAIAAFAWLCHAIQPGARSFVALGTALFALSPFHLVYAQEAREYSLWALLILLSTAALVSALRSPSPLRWSGYALSVLVGMYTHVLFAAVIAAHLVFALASSEQPARLSQRVRRAQFALPAAALAALAFVPWGVVMFRARQRLHQIMDWQADRMPVATLAQRWAGALGNTFVDLWYQDARASAPFLWYASRGAAALGAALALWALWFVSRRAPRAVAALILALAIVPFVAIAGPDVLLGGQRSAVSRYLTPSLIGAQLAVAYSLAAQIRSPRWSARVAGIALASAIIIAGIASDLIILQTDTWRNKGGQRFIEMAEIVNRADAAPFILADATVARGHVISLCRYLRPDVRIEFLAPARPLPASEPVSAVFLFGPAPDYRRTLESSGFSLERAIDMYPPLWGVVRSPASGSASPRSTS
jgi:uncharacterized membrane protein